MYDSYVHERLVLPVLCTKFSIALISSIKKEGSPDSQESLMTPVPHAQDENQRQECKSMEAKHREHFCVLIKQLGVDLHGRSHFPLDKFHERIVR